MVRSLYIEAFSRGLNSLELVQWPVFRLVEGEEEVHHSVLAVGDFMSESVGARTVFAMDVVRRGISGPIA